ncbi:TIGR04141 family sporadically distributed protein, partial [Klebsiella pneumoniae]|uniref:TIGR04141 family sporadically distributed protein n=1 Tax=Klebsiella pneumoniae TaxID=573 RepID=UPI0034E9649E
IRKEKLSIYLARDSHKSISELIKLDNVKRPIQLDLPDTELAELYIKIQPPKTVPPWTKIFTDGNQVESQEFGTSSNVGAVLVVRLTGSTFVLSFGT